MASVHFTQALRRFFPGLEDMEKQSDTVADLLQAIDDEYPGIRAYIVDDQGALRKHVNIFIDDVLIKDRKTLCDQVSADSEVFIMQALSGG